MAEVGTYYITIMPEMSKFTGAVSSALGKAGADGGDTYSKSFLDVVKGSAIGSAIGGVISSGLSAVKSGIEDGIKRLDTLNNYPKVMESLGYSSQESAKSIQLIRDHLDGLPTSTDSMVRLTQSVADSTGDLDLATKAALGFNDMMLATGASTEDMTNASTMLNRILGKQSATTEQWSSLQQYIPSQLSAIAEHMLGVGASSNDLYNALDDGTVSWNDFLQAIVELDETGEGAMGSFYEQAKAMTGGIGTTLENVPNRISAGWEKILDAIGSENISSTIDDMSYGVRDAMTRIGDAIKYVKDKVGDTKIAQNLKELGEAIGDTLSGIWNDGGPEMLKTFTDTMVDLIDKVLQWLVDHKDLVVAAVGGIAGAITMLVGFKIITTLTALPGIITAINTALMANPLMLIATLIGAVVMALYTFFTQTETGRKMWEDFTGLLKETWEGLKQGFEDFVNTVKQGFETQAEVWATFKENLAQWNENIRQAVIDKWNEIKTAIADYANQMVESAKAKWEEWSTGVAEWNEGIREAIVQKWEEIKTAIADYTSQMVESARAKWEEWQTGVAEWNENIRQAVVEKWEALKAGIAEKIESVLSNASAKWEAIKTMVVDKVLSLVDRVVRGFGVMHDTAIEIVDGIKNSIVEKFEWVKEKVEGIVDFLKGIFDFEWKLPDIQLPSIDIQWNDTGFGFSVPSFSVDWYAKGGIFDAATLIGIGEAGPEAVLPLNDRTYREIAAGIASQGGAQGGVTIKDCTFNVREDADIDRIADALSVRWLRDMGATA